MTNIGLDGRSRLLATRVYMTHLPCIETDKKAVAEGIQGFSLGLIEEMGRENKINMVFCNLTVFDGIEQS